MRGYFGIGIDHPKNEMNVGTLWRSAFILGASFIFTIGRRYKRQSSDTMESWRHVPLFNYATFVDFYESLPYDCRLIGVELLESATPIGTFQHPQRAIYLLGAEDNGLTKDAERKCHSISVLPGARSMNVAVAGSIVIYDRINKGGL